VVPERVFLLDELLDYIRTKNNATQEDCIEHMKSRASPNQVLVALQFLIDFSLILRIRTHFVTNKVFDDYVRRLEEVENK